VGEALAQVGDVRIGHMQLEWLGLIAHITSESRNSPTDVLYGPGVYGSPGCRDRIARQFWRTPFEAPLPHILFRS
jgi:hypothetical protein